MNDVVQTERAKLLRLEEALLREPQVLIEPGHTFAKGLYARSITIPKGVALTGHIHRFSHVNFILRGDISVLTEHGIQRIVGPAMLVSSPGIKRAGYTHEETVWVTVHATEHTNVEEIEEELLAKSFDEFESIAADERIALPKVG